MQRGNTFVLTDPQNNRAGLFYETNMEGASCLIRFEGNNWSYDGGDLPRALDEFKRDSYRPQRAWKRVETFNPAPFDNWPRKATVPF